MDLDKLSKVLNIVLTLIVIISTLSAHFYTKTQTEQACVVIIDSMVADLINSPIPPNEKPTIIIPSFQLQNVDDKRITSIIQKTDFFNTNPDDWSKLQKENNPT